MSRAEHPLVVITGHPYADARRKYETSVWPPGVQREIKAELERKEAEAQAQVAETVRADEEAWTQGFDAWTAEADAVADRTEEVALLAREGRLTADELDKELTRLDARRKVLTERAAEHERHVERIEAIKADPLKYLDSVYARYPALPRPEWSFLPSHGL
jgi:chromosome segregation ATPase